MGQFVIVIGATYGSTLDKAADQKTAQAFLLWKRTGGQRRKYTGGSASITDLGLVLYQFGTGSLAT